MKYCERCKENKAKYELEIPFQEEKIQLCLDCYLLVWELFAKWLNIKDWGNRISKFKTKLREKGVKV